MAAKPAAKPRWYQGQLTCRWEVSLFQPKDSKERWWVSFSSADDSSKQRLPLEGVAAGVEVRLYGTVSERGAYGHMGMYDREFTVSKIGTLSKAKETTEEKS